MISIEVYKLSIQGQANMAQRNQRPEKLEQMLTVKVPAAMHKAFLRSCQSQDTTASREVRRFMRSYVAQHGQASLPFTESAK